MKLGFSTVIYEELNLPLFEVVGKAAAFGYEGIEFNFKERPSGLNVNEIMDALKAFDLKIAAIGTRHMHVTHGLYLASPLEDVRRESIGYITECMKLANNLGCSTVQAGWAFQGSKLESPFDVTWRNAVQSLKEVGKRALEYGVNFVIEYANRYEAKLINTMDDALRILDEVSCENVLVMADVYHMNIEEASIGESIRKAGKRLGYVHLADSNRLAPGWGHTNFREIIEALKGIGYEGYLIMECTPKPSPDEALMQGIGFIRKIL